MLCLAGTGTVPACAARRAMVVKWAGLTESTVYKTGMDGFFHSCPISHIGTNGNSIVILELVNCSAIGSLAFSSQAWVFTF